MVISQKKSIIEKGKNDMSDQVFISYCREDKAFALQLIDDLRSHAIPVWYDANIRGGEAWANKIEDAVDESVIILVILSPDSVESYEVGNEIAYSLAKKKRIIPLMLRKCQTPLRLSSLNRHDFTGEYKPALLRLIADINGARLPDPLPPVPPGPKWYKRPIFYGALGLIVLLISFILIRGMGQHNPENPVDSTVAKPTDSTIASPRDTIFIRDTATIKPGEKRGRKFTGTIGGENIEMTIISQDGIKDITGTYFYVTNPSRQISFDGTEIEDVIRIRHLSEVNMSIKMIKTSSNTYNGALINSADGQSLPVILSRPRMISPQDIRIQPAIRRRLQ